MYFELIGGGRSSAKDGQTPSPCVSSSPLLFYESVCWALLGFIADLIVSL